MLKCGLLGKTLGHSRSPEIHRFLGDYEYLLYEKQEDELASFLQKGDWTGMNVTIPYKKAVLPFLDELSPVAWRIGSVNTIFSLCLSVNERMPFGSALMLPLLLWE